MTTTFKNLTLKPLAVDMGKQAIVVLPGHTFDARLGLPVIKKLISENKIARA